MANTISQLSAAASNVLALRSEVDRQALLVLCLLKRQQGAVAVTDATISSLITSAAGYNWTEDITQAYLNVIACQKAVVAGATASTADPVVMTDGIRGLKHLGFQRLRGMEIYLRDLMST